MWICNSQIHASTYYNHYCKSSLFFSEPFLSFPIKTYMFWALKRKFWPVTPNLLDQLNPITCISIWIEDFISKERVNKPDWWNLQSNLIWDGVQQKVQVCMCSHLPSCSVIDRCFMGSQGLYTNLNLCCMYLMLNTGSFCSFYSLVLFH